MSRRLRSLLSILPLNADREPYNKLASSADAFASGLNRSVMHLGNFLYQSQPDAEPCGRAFAVGQLGEHIKNGRQLCVAE